MRKKVVLAVSLAVFAAASILMEITSCTGKSGDASVIKTIKVGDYQEDNFDWKSVFEQDLHLVELTDTSKEYSFTEISKLVFKKDKFYISDWATRRIIVFDLNANPVFVLNRRGRGPEEYLQVTDFDVDNSGGLWILDGQKDAVSHYSSDGRFLSQSKTGDCQYSHIACSNENLLLSVAYWDKTENGGYKAVAADTNLNVTSRYGRIPEFYDPDFEFPSVGFSEIGDVLMYNNPIDDYVSVFENDEYNGDYYFDFGSKKVPDDVRKSVESHLESIADYTFLVNAVGVYKDYVVGTMMEGGSPKDFIINMKSGKMYKQPWDEGTLHLSAISDDRIILSGTDVEADKDVLAYVQLDKLKKHLK